MQITHGLAETLEQLAGESRRVRRAAARVPRRARQPRRARRRPAGRRPRRHAASDARAAAPARCASSRSTARRPGRPTSSACRSAATGRRLPRRGHGRLRPHAGPRAGVAQQHDQHRHRLRLRRPADCAALAGARARLGARRARRTTSRRGRSCRRAGPTPSGRGRTCSTSTTSPASGSSRPGSRGTVTVREENAAGALEVMSRFAIDPRWLVYLPPTMAPTATSARARRCWSTRPRRSPSSAREGVAQVVCEEKHMGSRAVVVVCRDADVAARALRRRPAAPARIYTRTGRPFFDDAELNRRCWRGCARRSTARDLWEQLDTDWLVLDCELMPWSAKAQELIAPPVRGGRRRRPARGLGAARRAGGGRGARPATSPTLLDGDARPRARRVDRYVDAYRRYCWPVDVARGPPARPVPRAGGRGRRLRRHATTAGTSSTATRCAGADPELLAAPTADRRPHRSRPSEAADRLVGAS